MLQKIMSPDIHWLHERKRKKARKVVKYKIRNYPKTKAVRAALYGWSWGQYSCVTLATKYKKKRSLREKSNSQSRSKDTVQYRSLVNSPVRRHRNIRVVCAKRMHFYRTTRVPDAWKQCNKIRHHNTNCCLQHPSCCLHSLTHRLNFAKPRFSFDFHQKEKMRTVDSRTVWRQLSTMEWTPIFFFFTAYAI